MWSLIENLRKFFLALESIYAPFDYVVLIPNKTDSTLLDILISADWFSKSDKQILSLVADNVLNQLAPDDLIKISAIIPIRSTEHFETTPELLEQTVSKTFDLDSKQIIVLIPQESQSLLGQDGRYHPKGYFLGRDGQYHPPGSFFGRDGKYHPQKYFFGRDGQYHPPGSFFGRDGKYHPQKYFFGRDGQYHPPGSFFGRDGKYHPVGSFLGRDGKYHPKGSFLGKDGKYHPKGSFFGRDGKYVDPDG